MPAKSAVRSSIKDHVVRKVRASDVELTVRGSDTLRDGCGIASTPSYWLIYFTSIRGCSLVSNEKFDSNAVKYCGVIPFIRDCINRAAVYRTVNKIELVFIVLKFELVNYFSDQFNNYV